MNFLEAYEYVLTKNKHKTLFKADFENLKIYGLCQNYGQNQGSIARN